MLVRSTVALAALLVLVAACDTDDGKTMRPPTSEQRVAATTTTSTTTVTTAIPADIGAGGVFGASTTTVAPASTTTTAPPPANAFTLTAPWVDGGPIDARFTCDGDDVSPQLTWTAPPSGTAELVLLVTDDDADGYVHQVVAGIPPTAGQQAEGTPIAGAVEGVNDFGDVGWGGPCPPAGAAHHYRFALYALAQQAELPDGFTGDDVLAIAGPSSIGLTELSGTYTRAG